jgi:hypothetical protein
MQRGATMACAAAVLAAVAGLDRGAAADEFEPNDFCGGAADIGNGTYTNLDVALGDSDWYHIVVPFGSQLIAEVDHNWGDGDIDISLYDECGGSIERFSWTASDFETVIYTNNGFDTDLYLDVEFVDFITDFNTYDLFIQGAEDTGGPACPCDLDGTPGVDVFDLLAYLDLWFPQDAAADIDGSAGVDVFDLLAFLDCWFPASAGSPC